MRSERATYSQDSQALENVGNNFWKPEPPSVLTEATAIPLSYVVSDAVKRWFDDTYRHGALNVVQMD